jgi:hypothetical protein
VSFHWSVVIESDQSQAFLSPDFEAFVTRYRPSLLRVLNAHYGTELGPEATAHALAFAERHWDEVRQIENPVGYLYRIGQSALGGRTLWKGRIPVLPRLDADMARDVETRLPAALAALNRVQRTAILLVHAHRWPLADAAAAMDVSVPMLTSHVQRGLDSLRQNLEVVDDD